MVGSNVQFNRKLVFNFKPKIAVELFLFPKCVASLRHCLSFLCKRSKKKKKIHSYLTPTSLISRFAERANRSVNYFCIVKYLKSNASRWKMFTIVGMTRRMGVSFRFASNDSTSAQT